MIQSLRQAIARPGAELVQDLVGAASLVVILVGALHLPLI